MDLVTFAQQQGIPVTGHEPMSRHTSFRIGGPARYFAQVEGWQAQKLYKYAIDSNLPFFLMGNGSNLLVRDEGFPGLVVKLAPGEITVTAGTRMEAPAGALLSTLSVAAQRHGLAGLEFAQGIPGSVGGAVFMNAGAYDGQISDTLVESAYMDLGEGGERRLTLGEHAFGYRHSAYMAHPLRVITGAVFQLNQGDPHAIAHKMAQFAQLRREKQPLEYPSAGSTYKRPPGHFAGKLIEEAGLKGYRVGGAQVSEKHGGFIVNRGGATCAEVLALMEHVELEVERRTGIRLEREIRLL